MTDFAEFADGFLFDLLANSPELALELGVREVNGRKLPMGYVDFSDEGADRRRGLMDAWRDKFHRLRTPPHQSEDRATWKTLAYLLDDGLFGAYCGKSGHGFPENPYPTNPITGWHPTFVSMLDRDFQIATIDDAHAYVEQLNAVPKLIDGVVRAFECRQRERICAPRTSLVQALNDIRLFLDPSPAENVLVESFRRKAFAAFRPEVANQLISDVQRAYTDRVLPSYARLVEAMQRQLADNRGDFGLCSHPDGESHYEWLLRGHTTMNASAAEVHEIGLEETAHVQAAIRREFATLGLSGGGIDTLFAQIGGPSYAAFPHGDRRRALDETQTLVDSLANKSSPFFHRLPRAKIEVELVPPEFEASQHSRYTPPAADGGRPGKFSFNFVQSQNRARWEMPVMCAHEVTPGHHLQLALAQELPLCALRRTLVFTAYIEGWAKYAETFLDHDICDDPYVRLGRLRGELYSSVNLALDTGLHALRWSREEGVEFFQRHTGVLREFAEIIVDRSLVTPGQLCAYKLGMLKFREIRKAYLARPNSTIPDFHDAVLSTGALPLGLLEECVLGAYASDDQAAHRPLETANAKGQA